MRSRNHGKRMCLQRGGQGPPAGQQGDSGAHQPSCHKHLLLPGGGSHQGSQMCLEDGLAHSFSPSRPLSITQPVFNEWERQLIGKPLAVLSGPWPNSPSPGVLPHLSTCPFKAPHAAGLWHKPVLPATFPDPQTHWRRDQPHPQASRGRVCSRTCRVSVGC